MNRPNKLVEARDELQRAEEDVRDPGRLDHLRKGVASLLELMSGVSPRIEKDIAKKLVLAYRDKVLLESKTIVAKLEMYEPEHLAHWNELMEVFVDPGLPNDPEFNECKERLLMGRPVNQPIDNVKPTHIDILKTKELQAVSSEPNFDFRKRNEVRTTLHAACLSALGQYLDIFRLRAFALEKKGDFYVLRSEALTEAHEWTLRNHSISKFDRQILNSRVPDPENTNITVGDGWLCYGPLNVAFLNGDNHRFEQTHEGGKLAQFLGTLGEHFDSKKATAFRISLSYDSLSVEYQMPNGVGERRAFTFENLEQLASYSIPNGEP